MWQEVPRFVHDLDKEVTVWNTDMDMEPEDQDRANDILQVVFEQLVAVNLGDKLALPVGEGVGARSHDREAALGGEFGPGRCGG